MSQSAIEGQLQVSGGVGQALLAMLDTMASRVLGQQPVDSKGNPTGQVMYLQTPTGQPIDPQQYANPWTPAGGDTMAAITGKYLAPNAPASSTSSSSSSGAASTPPAPQLNSQLQASIEAAFQTSLLVDELYEVTGDGTLQGYPTSRSLSFAYGSIIKGMQPLPAPPPSAQVEQAVQAALLKLYTYDSKGNMIGQTPEYQAYLANQMAWAQAKANYATDQAYAMADPILGSAWPETSAVDQTAVDQAYDTWMAQGAADIEQALATVSSVGLDVQAAMVTQARQLFDAWNLGIAGLPSETAYSMITPTNWYDSTDESVGFEKLTVSSNDWSEQSATASNSYASNWYNGQSSSTSGEGGAMFMGFMIGGGASHSDSSDAQGASGGSGSVTTFDDQTTNVTITFEWGLCRIERPWLVSDLFHMSGWYLVNAKKNSISDGTIAGQVKNQQQLMPMIPTAFLVVRNVTIKAENWGQAGIALAQASRQEQSSDQSSSNSETVSAGYLFIGGSVSHSDAQDSGQGSSGAQSSGSFSFSGGSAGGTLTIHGSQILGWVGEIVPACPSIDDPGLASSSGSGQSGSSASGQSASGQSGSGQSGGSGSGQSSGDPGQSGDDSSADPGPAPSGPTTLPGVPAGGSTPPVQVPSAPSS
ncbi:MAG TPA: hypothetical protein VGL63_01935 [Streptosporangiaceae bacterium]